MCITSAKSTTSLWMYILAFTFFLFFFESWLLSIYLPTPPPALGFCDYTWFCAILSTETRPLSSVHILYGRKRHGEDTVCLLSWGPKLGAGERVPTWSSVCHWWLSRGVGLELRRWTFFSAEPSFCSMARRLWHFPDSGIGNASDSASQALIYLL